MAKKTSRSDSENKELHQSPCLILTDGYSIDRLVKLVSSLPIERWIYLGHNAITRLHLEKAFGGGIPRTSIVETMDKITKRLKPEFLNLIGKLALRNSSPLWWSTKLAAKDPHHSALFPEICLMSLGKNLLRQSKGRPSAILVENPTVWESLKDFAEEANVPVRNYSSARSRWRRPLVRCLRGVRRHLWMWRQIRSRQRELIRRGLRTIPAFSGERTALLFTWVDHRNFTDSGEYQDPHFGPLPNHLQKRGYRLVYVARLLNSVEFGPTLDRLQQTGESFIYPEAALGKAQILRTMWQALRYRPTLPDPISLDGMEVTDLVRQHVRDEWETTSHATAMTSYYAMQILADLGVQPETIFYTHEGHNWSHAMGLGVKSFMPNTHITAFVNLISAPMLLSLHASRDELSCMPLAEKYVTHGPHSAQELKQEGYPKNRVLDGAAIRHDYIWKRPARTTAPVLAGKARVLIVPHIDMADAVELVVKASKAFSGLPDYDLIAKCHPAVQTEALVRELDRHLDSIDIEFSDAPIAELLPQVNVLLYTYTSVCFEALAHGVPPVYVHPENWLCMDQLSGSPDCRWTATSPEELRNTVAQVLDMSEASWKVWYTRARQELETYLPPVTEDRLDRFLFNHGQADSHSFTSKSSKAFRKIGNS